ncbi:hypothetical protein ColTof4_02646 [Colletotrichum tofieldiae]|nr:hypothetical protein ColTof3_09062 [Colletotrichum tofieldiae]GKT70223.1 hypothetical protein ColTof4_02646 [Colletotrichum tofieldiae]GKT93274.1 hypothetical protein Ct61P_11124 [Colletotrichum tofieldiae]
MAYKKPKQFCLFPALLTTSMAGIGRSLSFVNMASGSLPRTPRAKSTSRAPTPTPGIKSYPGPNAQPSIVDYCRREVLVVQQDANSMK